MDVVERGKREWFCCQKMAKLATRDASYLKELCEWRLVITVSVTFKATRRYMGISFAFECYTSTLLLVKSLMAT